MTVGFNICVGEDWGGAYDDAFSPKARIRGYLLNDIRQTEQLPQQTPTVERVDADAPG